MPSGNPNPNESTRFQAGNTVGQQFEPGNEARLVHGVRRAMEDLAAGRPLRGDLAAIQHRYAAKLETHEGRIEAQRWLAGAFFAIAEGLLAVIQDALESDDKERAVVYARHFGTVGSKAGNENQRLAELEGTRADRALDYEALIEELRQ